MPELEAALVQMKILKYLKLSELLLNINIHIQNLSELLTLDGSSLCEGFIQSKFYRVLKFDYGPLERKIRD